MSETAPEGPKKKGFFERKRDEAAEHAMATATDTGEAFSDRLFGGPGTDTRNIFQRHWDYQRAPRTPRVPGQVPFGGASSFRFEDGYGDFEEGGVPSQAIPRDFTKSESPIVAKHNIDAGREINPTRIMNNKIEAGLPTTLHSVLAGLVSPPINVARGIGILASAEKREQSEQDVMTALPTVKALHNHGPKEVGKAGLQAVGDKILAGPDLLKKTRKYAPQAKPLYESHQDTPPEEIERLQDNMHEVGFQTGVKTVTGIGSGMLMAKQVKNLVVPRMPPRMQALTAVVIMSALMGTKMVGMGAEHARTFAKHHDKRLATKGEGGELHYQNRLAQLDRRPKPSTPTPSTPEREIPEPWDSLF